MLTVLRGSIVHSFQQRPMLTNGAAGMVIFSAGDVLSQTVTDRDVIDYSRAIKTGMLGIVMNGGAVSWSRRHFPAAPRRASPHLASPFLATCSPTSPLSAVVLHKWYVYLDAYFGRRRSPRLALYKTIADQVVYSPLAIAVFFGHASLVEAAAAANDNNNKNSSSSRSSSSSSSSSSSKSGSGSSSTNTWQDVLDVARNEFQDKMQRSFLPTLIADCCVWPIANMVNFRYVPLNYRPSFVGVVQIAWQSYVNYVGYKKF